MMMVDDDDDDDEDKHDRDYQNKDQFVEVIGCDDGESCG